MTAQNTGIQPQKTSSMFALHGGLRGVSLFLVAIGLLICGYLVYVQTTNAEIVCAADGGAGCDIVQNSIYAEIFGIKIAYLGFTAYAVLGALIAFEQRIPFLRDYGLLITFVLVTLGFIYSVYLVYIQAVVLQAFCQWCLGHEAVMTLLFTITSIRLWQSFNVDGDFDEELAE